VEYFKEFHCIILRFADEDLTRLFSTNAGSLIADEAYTRLAGPAPMAEGKAWEDVGDVGCFLFYDAVSSRTLALCLISN